MKGAFALGALLVAMAGAMPVTSANRSGLESAVAVAAPEEVIDDVPLKREPAPPPRAQVPADNSLRVGARSPVVLAMEERLASLHYMVGKVDGVYDGATGHGVMAFQKYEGLKRTGRADENTLSRLNDANIPQPRFATPDAHIEVDVARQVVLVVKGGQVAEVLPAVTGNGKRFWHPQRNRYVTATTPNGRFRIYRKVFELRVSPLGRMYWPSYFNGGIALHGSPYMVSYPGSHGCVRLPMQFAEWFYRNVSPIGTTVYVYGGPEGENPQPYISDAPAEPSPSPSPTSPSPSPSESPSPLETPTVQNTP